MPRSAPATRLQEVWTNFRAMPGAERRLSAEALGILALATVGLRLVGFRRISRILANSLGRIPAEPAPGAATPEACIRAVNRAAHYLAADSRCLARSSALWWLLRRRGYRPDLCVGARRVANGIEAHAWIELAGTVVNDRPDIGEQFARFAHPFFPEPPT